MNQSRMVIAAAFLCSVGAHPAAAISSNYRAALEWSGCDMQSEATWCDIHKPRSDNDKNRPPDPGKLSSTEQAERNDIKTLIRDHIVGRPKREVFLMLKDRGFQRENDGNFYRLTDRSALHVLLTYATDGYVKSARVQ